MTHDEDARNKKRTRIRKTSSQTIREGVGKLEAEGLGFIDTEKKRNRTDRLHLQRRDSE